MLEVRSEYALKSPMRENRTSGSVAGYSSDPISYANGEIPRWFKDKEEERARRQKEIKNV